MFFQFLLGTLITLATVLVAATGFWTAEGVVTWASRWLIRPPHALKLSVVLMGAVTGVLAILSISVSIWALALLGLGIFDALEPAMYFSIVAFTTLGFGDILLPLEWRILGGLAATNGLLNMGLYGAMLVEILRRVRSEQVKGAVDE